MLSLSTTQQRRVFLVARGLFVLRGNDILLDFHHFVGIFDLQKVNLEGKVAVLESVSYEWRET